MTTTEIQPGDLVRTNNHPDHALQPGLVGVVMEITKLGHARVIFPNDAMMTIRLAHLDRVDR